MLELLWKSITVLAFSVGLFVFIGHYGILGFIAFLLFLLVFK
jgi:hypothetical protein